MKSKAALTLIEQTIIVLVLTVAAAVCLRVFLYADGLSKKNTAMDAACTQAQSAAEILKACRGDMAKAAGSFGGSVEDGSWVVYFDEQWQQSAEAAEYVLMAEIIPSGIEYLGKAQISVCGVEELFSLELCWQEENRNG